MKSSREMVCALKMMCQLPPHLWSRGGKGIQSVIILEKAGSRDQQYHRGVGWEYFGGRDKSLSITQQFVNKKIATVFSAFTSSPTVHSWK